MKVYLKVFASMNEIRGASQEGLDKAFGCGDSETVRFNLAAALRAYAEELESGSAHRTLKLKTKVGEPCASVNSSKTVELDAPVVLQKVDRKAVAAAKRAPREEQSEEQAIENLLGELAG